MPWIMQMLGFALFLLGIGIALWLSVWILLLLFAVGVAAVVYVKVKTFLLEKGILNPTPGVPPGEAPTTTVTVIEGDYQRVDSE